MVLKKLAHGVSYPVEHRVISASNCRLVHIVHFFTHNPVWYFFKKLAYNSSILEAQALVIEWSL